ncbi:uncharacterized protein LDX57_000476 [Aspergillus melleus]|uniref:uncharacterized protein n=1 Tax=Aspergillus melleus TaxID=138277 RepID=UPI001E8E0AFB|nr:uncharacterized protein LDX57_000476 [Aspergillus melleus]KAH8422722.1 hypothetical protein LDX57_000476 [Aspergillus melleus]
MKKRRVGYLFAFYYMGIESRIYVMKDLVSLAAWDMIWMRNVHLSFGVAYRPTETIGDSVASGTSIPSPAFSGGNAFFLILDIRRVIRFVGSERRVGIATG